MDGGRVALAPETQIGRILDFCLGLRFEDIPSRDLERAELLLLDLIGVAAGAEATEASRIAHDTAGALFSAGAGQTAARILLDGRAVSPAGAAYAGAAQIDNIDAHDGYSPAKGHVGVVLLPAIAAFADSLGRPVGGREVLSCLVMGYELGSRAALALHGTVSDYHTSGAWNALAVAAVGCRLRGLPPAQLREALGIAEYHGPRSQMMREIDNPTMLHDGSAWGALAGVSAVYLAERGFTGAPAITLEGENAGGFWHDLGKRWLTREQYVKPYPVCRWAHAPIDGVLRLRAAHGFTTDEIEAVEIRTFHESARLFSGVPQTTARAQYSLAFTVAAALARGSVGLAEISEPAFRDELILALMPRIRVIEDPRHQARFPEGRWGDVTVVLKNGRRLESGDINARGGPDDPLSAEEMIAKYESFAAPVMGEERCNAVRQSVFALREEGSDFSGLLDLLVQPPLR